MNLNKTALIDHSRSPVRGGTVLKFLVHTSYRFNKGHIGEEGVGKTLGILPEAKALELFEPGDNKKNSYAGNFPHDVLTAGYNGFIFFKEPMFKLAPYLNGTTDVIMCGGASKRCFTLALLSMIAAKTMGVPSLLDRTFTRNIVAYNLAKEMDGLAPADFGLVNGRHFNIHMNCEAIYTDLRDICFIGDLLYTWEARGQSGNSEDFYIWAQLRERFPDYSERIARANFRFLPKYHKNIFERSGLNIQGFLDGKKCDEAVSKGIFQSVWVNLYYWSDTASLAKYFKKLSEKSA
jgi:hypothetical protein